MRLRLGVDSLSSLITPLRNRLLHVESPLWLLGANYDFVDTTEKPGFFYNCFKMAIAYGSKSLYKKKPVKGAKFLDR